MSEEQEDFLNNPNSQPQQHEPETQMTSGNSRKGGFKISFKHWSGTVVIGAIAAFVIWGFLYGQEFLANFLINREGEKRAEEFYNREYYDNDYGGKSPEETYELFLRALRERNFELASRYFTVEKQDGFKESVANLQKTNQLQESIKQLTEAKNNWKLVEQPENGAIYEYKYFLERSDFVEIPLGGGEVEIVEYPPGEYIGQITFEKNPYTGVWKLRSL